MFKKLKLLLYPVKHVKKAYFVLILSGIANGIRSVFQVQILAFIVGAIQAKNLGVFNFWFICFVLIKIIGFIVIYSLYHSYSTSFAKIRYILSEIYLSKLLKLDNNKVEILGTGRINSIISKGIDNWCHVLTLDFQEIFMYIISIIYTFGVIYFTTGVKFFLIIIFLFFVNFLWAYYFNNLGLQFRTQRKDEEVAFDRNFIKIIMSKFEILQNNKFLYESGKLKNITGKILKLWRKEDDRGAIGTIGANLIISLILFSVFIYIGKGVINGNFQLSYFVLIYGLVDILERHIWIITNNIRMYGINIVGVDKLLETFDNITEIPGINNPIPFVYKKGDIELREVTFGYGDDNIFKSFNLVISGGKKTALVGDSGSGKTTLMKLLAGYIHPKSGDIVVDGQNISDINLISYYKNIGYLTQDPSVFDGTVRDNLLYALDREPTQLEIDNTIKSSKCEFILELPNGFDTEIGERGIKLSGGQKQRLAIAKIMLKNPNIILLDEPTSALDSISEQIVSEALHNLFNNRTVIIIAHRLQTVKESDEIIVFKRGVILERGNHEELSRKEDGEYRKMLELQTSF